MKDTSGRIAIVVLGMHRSGTSSLAGLLTEFGCSGPATGMPADEWNAKGYFESKPVFRFNDAVLRLLGSRWDEWRPFRKGWRQEIAEGEVLDRAKEVLDAEYGDAPLIYLKDPRICRLFPLWERALKETGRSVRVAHTHRNPVEVGASIERRDGKLPSLIMLSWLRHVIEAERETRGQARFFTSYDALLENHVPVMDRMGTTLDVDWPTRPSNGAGQLDISLRHHKSKLDAFVENWEVSQLVRTTLGIMERWARGGERAEDHATLDRIHEEFNYAAGVFSTPIRALETRLEEEVRRVKAVAATGQAASAAESARETLPVAHVSPGDDERDSTIAQLTAEVTQLTDNLIARDKMLNRMRADSVAAFTYAEETRKRMESLQEIDLEQKPAKKIVGRGKKKKHWGRPKADKGWLHHMRYSRFGRKVSRLLRWLKGRS